MLPLHRVSRLLRWAAAFVVLAVLSGIAQAQTTTLSGTVYSPNGPTAGDPIPNILVFAVNPLYPPPVFSQGVSAGPSGQNNCALQPSLVPNIVLGSAVTDANGRFQFTTSGVIPNPLTIVIQAGKWRRQYQFDNTLVTQGAASPLPAMSMPGSQAQGDLPHIAIVTGEADVIECIFNQIGIANSEFTDPGGNGSINLYVGNATGGEAVSSASPLEASLVSTSASLNKYDLVMFGCQGGTNDSSPATYANNLTDYTSAGGRVFATHYEYIWLQDNSAFTGVAGWENGNLSTTQEDSGTAVINVSSSFPQGTILADWLQGIGALSSVSPPEVTLTNLRLNTNSVNLPAQSWANVPGITGDPSMQFSFDTPIGATATPAVSLTFVNHTTTFLAGDAADTVSINVTNNSTTATSAGLILTIAMPAGLMLNSLVDSSGGHWICNAGSATCMQSGVLAAGAVDSVLLTFNVSSTQGVGPVSINAALTGGGLANTNQCGRVLYNDYHVEQPSGKISAGILYNNGANCPLQSKMTNAQKFLEYSLYNLSNFVSPSNSDLIVIAGLPALTWPTPAAIPYGTALSAAQLDATAAYAGAAVPGTFTYTPPAGTTTLPVGSNPATNTLSVVFTPTNTMDYISTNGSVVQTVTQDTTSVSLTSGTNPSYLGQAVTFTAQTATNGGIAAGQTVNFFDGLTLIGSVTSNMQGAATYTTSALIVGTHNLTACVVATLNFGASCSPVLVQLVTLIPTPPLTTSSVLTSNANPSYRTQSVTFTVGVATTGAFSTIPVGTVTFYDGAAVIGTGTLNAAGFATFSTSTLALGTHTLTAVYGGSNTLAKSTSNVVLELVLTSLPTAGTGFLLTVDPATLSIGVGESKVLNVSVLGLNNYQVPVNLTCTGTPTESACTFANAAMPAGGGVTTVTFGVAAPHACGTSTPYFVASDRSKRGIPMLGVGVLALLFVGRRRKLRRLTQGLMLALALCVLPMLGGCGGACTDFGTQPGSYAFKITATPSSGTVAPQSQTITVNVHL
jgi:hypothetical protein